MSSRPVIMEGNMDEVDIQVGAGKNGARVYVHPDGVVLVKQTVKRGDRYVIDEQRERFVDPGNDSALGAAVRAATQGML